MKIWQKYYLGFVATAIVNAAVFTLLRLKYDKELKVVDVNIVKDSLTNYFYLDLESFPLNQEHLGFMRITAYQLGQDFATISQPLLGGAYRVSATNFKVAQKLITLLNLEVHTKI